MKNEPITVVLNEKEKENIRMLVNMIVLETTTYVVKNALEKILVSINVMGNLQNAGMQLTTEKIQKKRRSTIDIFDNDEIGLFEIYYH